MPLTKTTIGPGRRGTLALAALAMGMVAIGAVVIGARAVGLLSGSSSAETTPSRKRSAVSPTSTTDAPKWWLGSSPALLKSQSGDVPNIVAVARWPGGATELTALEGTTGKVLWHVPAANGVTVYTNVADIVLLFDPVKKLARFDARTGSVIWTVTLADNVYDVAFGPSCASLILPGSRPLGIDTDTGKPSPCTPFLAPTTRAPEQDVQLQRGDLRLVGSVQLDGKPVNPAPPRLAVKASRAGRELWHVAPSSLEPVWTSAGFGRSLVLAEAGVFVYGRSSGNHQARWLLLELSAGRTLYEQTGTTKVESKVYLAAAGPLVFVVHDQRLEAFRAATGALVWFVGSE